MSESEKFALATHVYVRLRRASGRVVDAVWMARNDDYAREIIGIARSIAADGELQSLCTRFEALLRSVPARRPLPSAPVSRSNAPLAPLPTSAPAETASQFGTLR